MLKLSPVGEPQHSEQTFVGHFRHDGQEFCIGTEAGLVIVYRIEGGVCTKLRELRDVDADSMMPVMGIKYLAPSEGNELGNVVAAADAGGNIRFWHTSSGNLRHTISAGMEAAFTCMDVSANRLVVGGYDFALRVYDVTTRKLIKQLGDTKGKISTEPSVVGSHNNRVFSVIFHPADDNIVFSGGWDDMVFMWDVDLGVPLKRISGPHLAGAGLAFDAGSSQLFTASYKFDCGLACWAGDLSSMNWQCCTEEDRCHLFHVTMPSTRSDFIIACGSQPNEVRFHDATSGKIIARKEMEHAVFYTATSPDDKYIIVLGAGGCQLMELQQQEE
eukprot:m.23926 g.23926  ORF g.23926 m.23926 type:complete len:330 (+) comp8544_c0_seq2:95-1084(+)